MIRHYTKNEVFHEVFHFQYFDPPLHKKWSFPWSFPSPLLRILSHLLEKSLMENFNFCAVCVTLFMLHLWFILPRKHICLNQLSHQAYLTLLWKSDKYFGLIIVLNSWKMTISLSIGLNAFDLELIQLLLLMKTRNCGRIWGKC